MVERDTNHGGSPVERPVHVNFQVSQGVSSRELMQDFVGAHSPESKVLLAYPSFVPQSRRRIISTAVYPGRCFSHPFITDFESDGASIALPVDWPVGCWPGVARGVRKEFFDWAAVAHECARFPASSAPMSQLGR